MGVTRTKTIKNKHAAAPGGAKSSKRSGPEGGGFSKPKKPNGTPPSKQVKDKGREALLQKFKNPKKKKYTDEQLGIPELNTVTPVGVVKPRGKKKGKIFADDQVRRYNSQMAVCNSNMMFLPGEHEHYYGSCPS
jgi:60S ribosomal subunit assembly/export protein LOC1